MQFHVDITRDPVSRVWITKKSNVPGLAMYDQSPERLLERLPHVVPYLIWINNPETFPEMPIELAVTIHDRGEARLTPVQVIRPADYMPTTSTAPLASNYRKQGAE